MYWTNVVDGLQKEAASEEVSNSDMIAIGALANNVFGGLDKSAGAKESIMAALALAKTKAGGLGQSALGGLRRAGYNATLPLTSPGLAAGRMTPLARALGIGGGIGTLGLAGGGVSSLMGGDFGTGFGVGAGIGGLGYGGAQLASMYNPNMMLPNPFAVGKYV